MVERAVATYPAVQAAHANVRAAAAGVGLARSAYLPRIGLSGAYQRQDPVATFTLPSASGAPHEVAIAPHDVYDAHLGVEQQIYDFGRTRARVDEAKAGERAAQTGADQVREGVALDAVRGFYAALFLAVSAKVERDVIARFEEAKRVAVERREHGVGTDFEVLQTETRISAAESRLVSIESARRNALTGLRSLLGLPASARLDLSGSLDHTREAQDPSALVERAERLRPELQVARAELARAKDAARSARASDNPTLGVSAQAGVRDGYPIDVTKAHFNSLVGAQLTVPLFDGTARRGAKVAAARVEAAAADAERTRREVDTEVRQAYENLQASFAELESATAQATQAAQAGELARTRYKAGTITNLDLLDAETTLAQARLGQARVSYDILLRQSALHHAVGDLLATLAGRR